MYELDLGILVALALSLHDIPCGISLSVTSYCATDSYCKPFLLCFYAAIAYPIGAFFGWIIVETNNDSETLTSILFGIVSGIMMYIVLVQIFPEAIKNINKTNKKWVKISSYAALFIGLLVMELCSIILAALDIHDH